MKKIVSQAICLCFFLALTPAAGSNKLFAKGKWQLEFQAGWSPIAPADLNIMSNYWRHYLQFNYAQYYEVLHQYYGSDFTYMGFYDQENLFPELKTILPLTLSIRYRLNQRLYLSLGLSYFRQKDTPLNSSAFNFQDSRPDNLDLFQLSERALKYQFELAASGWVPALTIHYRLPLGQKFYFEGYLGGGPFFAACTYAHTSINTSTYPDGFWRTSESNLHAKGSSVGIALSAGLRCGWQLLKNLEIFTAAGYDFRQARSIKGKAVQEIRYGDKESVPGAYATTNWEGPWRIRHLTSGSQWGTFEDDLLYFGESYPNYTLRDFSLDLSAFQLRAGIAFCF